MKWNTGGARPLRIYSRNAHGNVWWEMWGWICVRNTGSAWRIAAVVWNIFPIVILPIRRKGRDSQPSTSLYSNAENFSPPVNSSKNFWMSNRCLSHHFRILKATVRREKRKLCSLHKVNFWTAHWRNNHPSHSGPKIDCTAGLLFISACKDDSGAANIGKFAGGNIYAKTHLSLFLGTSKFTKNPLPPPKKK